ncbi:glycine oxidase ThiO [Micromonospora sp. WMMD1102]|uniref:glycine oxidase ThiO n=1 Tax=Micromonospora sp. WMMD1102 TaxID=3016105 RepID=UPI0024156308|nr:glycine oxidase ThiO [Micromonospora sp. WMMD1102]MDG4789925.1 glycine oxidase ThiO [Micromonospora sp. WMMD1102]
MVGTGRADVAVVGGGPIGLAVAWRCAARGMRVDVYDDDPGSGASDVAAGMLAPVAETYFGERVLTGLLVESAARWPGFAAELGEYTGVDLGYRTEGTLTVALTSDDLAEAERLWTYQRNLGLPVTPLRPAELREREPLLATRLRGGAFAPGDHQVDPRRLVAALRVAAERAGVNLVPRPVRRLAELDAAATVVAAGCGTAALTGLPVRPVKGQILRLRAPGGATPGFRHVIRGHADGRGVYLVPRIDGEVVVGATVEERADLAVTAGAVFELLRAATEVLPELTEYELVEARSGLRPGTPDNAPLLGPLPDRPDVVVAAGHFRHGIVLTPLTADLVADLLATGVPDPALAPLSPARFAELPTPTARPARPGAASAPSRADRDGKPAARPAEVPAEAVDGPVTGGRRAEPDDETKRVGRTRWS